MDTQVIVLNGGSSSGKSSLARALQGALPGPWLTMGVDTFLGTLPPSMLAGPEGIGFGPGGEVETGLVFRQLDRAWSIGVAAMARAGAGIIADDSGRCLLAGSLACGAGSSGRPVGRRPLCARGGRAARTGAG